jgi:hypothetical protein
VVIVASSVSTTLLSTSSASCHRMIVRLPALGVVTGESEAVGCLGGHRCEPSISALGTASRHGSASARISWARCRSAATSSSFAVLRPLSAAVIGVVQEQPEQRLTRSQRPLK